MRTIGLSERGSAARIGAAMAMSISIGASAVTLMAAEPPAVGKEQASGTIVLKAKDLYGGFEARKVLPDKAGEKLVLDGRVFTAGSEKQGRVITDAIDLGPSQGILGLPGEVKAATIEATAEVPEGAAVDIETRSGSSFFDQSGWSAWQKMPGLTGRVADLKGRYLQVRLVLKAATADKLPAVTALSIKPEAATAATPAGKMEIVQAKIQGITNSPIAFEYERPDQEKLAKFRKDNDLDGVAAGKYDEPLGTAKLSEIDKSMNGGEDFIRLVRLMDWVGHCFNDRTVHKESEGGRYQWNIEKVFELKEVETNGTKSLRPTIYGHCMSYSEVLVTAATAMGYVGARHMCMVGFRKASHEITDIWVPSLAKWVYFDPSLCNYYYDKQTKVPMSLIEMHNLVADKFLRDGENMNWWCDYAPGTNSTQARVREVGGKAHIGSRLGPWCYGAPMQPNYDWGWRHGYLAAGFVQMTPRNDFHSHPELAPRGFGNYPGYGGNPFWVDDKTPPSRGVNNWFTRLRDFYWTLDQAGIRLLRTSDSEISVELGNSMPFFKRYTIKANGKEIVGAKNPFVWTLKAGENTLEVAPVDEFGKRGLASSVTVKYNK